MDNIPWIEKYRPSSLDDIILNEYTKCKLKGITIDNLSNILLCGPPGTGKTTTALTISRDLLKDRDNMIELNASDNRGINMINDFILKFCKTRGTEKLKIVILDEADNITKKAQEQLINFMENYSHIKFIFTCNDSTQIIEPLQSRCLLLKFQHPSTIEINRILENISNNEKINIDKNISDELLLNSDYDIRKSINNLEAMYTLYTNITIENLREYFTSPHIENLFQLLFYLIKKKDINKAMEIYNELVNSGINNLDLITYLLNFLQNFEDFEKKFKLASITKNISIEILDLVHECYFRMSKTVESKLQIINLFYKCLEL